MKPQINDVVHLAEGIPSESLPTGAIGTIVAVFAEPEEAYEVEFCDENGETVVQLALRPTQFVVMPLIK